MYKFSLFVVRMLVGLFAILGYVNTANTGVAGCKIDQPPNGFETACTIVIQQNMVSKSDRAEAFYLRGYGRIIRNQYKLAATDLDEGLLLAPNHNRLHRHRGRAALGLGNTKKAFYHILRAIDLYPQGYRERFVLGLIFLHLKQDDQALESFNKAVSLKHDDIWSLYKRVEILTRAKRYADALKDVEKLTAIGADKLKKSDPAEIYFKSVRMDVAIKINRAFILSKLGKFDESIIVASNLVKSNRSSLTMLVRAQLLSAIPTGFGFPSRHNEAIRDYKFAVLYDPKYSYAWQMLAYEQNSSVHNKDALYANEQALRTNTISSNFPDLLWQRGQIFKKSKNYEEAVRFGIAAMEHALKLPPRIVDIYVTRLRNRGYWTREGLPTEMDEDFVDVITACFHDKQCG